MRTSRRKSRNKVAAVPPGASAETRSVELELSPDLGRLPAGGPDVGGGDHHREDSAKH